MKRTTSSNLRISVWVSLVILSLIAYTNKQLFFAYYEYIQYNLAKNLGEPKFEINGYLARTITYASEAGYICRDRKLPSDAAYQKILLRRKNLVRANSYNTNDCIKLPTGEIILEIADDVASYYILIKVDESHPSGYHIIDIRGQMMG